MCYVLYGKSVAENIDWIHEYQLAILQVTLCGTCLIQVPCLMKCSIVSRFQPQVPLTIYKCMQVTSLQGLANSRCPVAVQEKLKCYCSWTQSHYIDRRRRLYVIGVEQTYGEFLSSKTYYRSDFHTKVKTWVTSYICNTTAQTWSR